jgi:DNA-binding GntR family transcriptional regulator
MAGEQTTLNTAQTIAQALREQILSGELAPHTRVTQRDLAAKFGFSPMPARDAVKMLLAEGLVVQEGSKTIVVAPTNSDDFVEIMDMRTLLEPRALELSVPHLTEADFAAARAALARSGTTRDLRQMVADHWSFHRVLYCRAGRSRLLNLIEQHHNLLARYLLPEWGQYGVMDNWADDEMALMDLVERGDAAAAAAWLKEDLILAKQRVVRTARQ